MPKIHDSWTILPHGPLEELDDGLLTVTGDIPMPLGNFPRRMTVVRLSEGRTAIWSGIALPEAEMARIEAMGTPAWLVIPNAGHRLDAKAYKQRYPNIRVLTPPGSKAMVEEVVPVDATRDPFDDPEVHFALLAGVGETEGAMTVRRGDRLSLLTNDIIGNVRHPNGIGAHIMTRLMGFGINGPRIPRISRSYVKDPGSLAVQFRLWAGAAGLMRIIPSHGDIIASEPAAVLRRIADGL